MDIFFFDCGRLIAYFFSLVSIRMLHHFLARNRSHLEAAMVSYDLDLRAHTVRSTLIGPPQCDPCLGLRGASFTDDLPLLTCADLLLAWQECVLLVIKTLIVTADILQL